MTVENIERLLPEEKEYSVVKINTMKSPGDESAAVKQYEVDDLEEASTPNTMGSMYFAYDADGNRQKIG